LKKGSLKRHQQIGTNLQIGEKGTGNMLDTLRSDIVSSFNSDLRIESIPFIELLQEGGTININMVVKIKNVDQPIPLPLVLEL